MQLWHLKAGQMVQGGRRYLRWNSTQGAANASDGERQGPFQQHARENIAAGFRALLRRVAVWQVNYGIMFSLNIDYFK
jgi:hypothetical protein